MFCPYSGYMMQFDPVRGVAFCPQTGYTKQLAGAARCAALACFSSEPALTCAAAARRVRMQSWRISS